MFVGFKSTKNEDLIIPVDNISYIAGTKTENVFRVFLRNDLYVDVVSDFFTLCKQFAIGFVPDRNDKN